MGLLLRARDDCRIPVVMRLLLVFVALLLAAPLIADERNEKCPLMTGDDIDEEQLVEYEGVKVWFCCQHCRKIWNRNQKYIIKASLDLLPQFDALKDRLALDKVDLLPQRFCPVNPDHLVTPDSPTVEFRGEKVRLWDEDAVKTWNKDPEGWAKRAIAAGLLPQFAPKKP